MININDREYLINKFLKIIININFINNNTKFLEKQKYKNKNKDNNLYLLIPKGIKVFLWFTYLNDKNVCVLIKLKHNYSNYNNIIYDIEIVHLCFTNTLAYGTLLYGTFLNIKNTKFFICEDIYQYKNNYINNIIFKNKLYIIQEIFKNNIKNNIYTNNSIIILFAIISNDYNYLYNLIPTLSYSIYAIKHFNMFSNNYYYYEKYRNFIIKEKIFKVKASLEQDIYYLYHNDAFYDIAHISSYKNSIYMNKLFRNIKENINLDLLEESDSDSDFEDVSIDKYVDLNKSILMICKYNDKFTKWEPYKLYN